jgi:hypothetical protein
MRAALLACAIAACVEGSPAQPDAAVDAGAIRVACDGALCATDNGGTCNASAQPAWLLGALVAIAGSRRRRSR